MFQNIYIFMYAFDLPESSLPNTEGLLEADSSTPDDRRVL
jgi:hypothetical protein